MKFSQLNKHKAFIALVFAMLFAFVYLQNRPLPSQTEQTIRISDQRANHILYGDVRGGGHKFGIGTPCKSEFPSNWNDAKIISTAKQIAANDNINWRAGRNGYFVGEQMIDGVNVRVVLDAEKDDIITAYPTNRPRNPCPANDR